MPENLGQVGANTKIVLGISSTLFGLSLLIACPLALFSPIVAFWCGDDRGAIGSLLSVITLVTLLSWPVVIIYSIKESWRLYRDKIYKQAIYFSTFPLTNVILFILVAFLDSVLFDRCLTPVE